MDCDERLTGRPIRPSSDSFADRQLLFQWKAEGIGSGMPREGSGMPRKPRKGSKRPMKSQGKAVEGQEKAKERQWTDLCAADGRVPALGDQQRSLAEVLASLELGQDLEAVRGQ